MASSCRIQLGAGISYYVDHLDCKWIYVTHPFEIKPSKIAGNKNPNELLKGKEDCCIRYSLLCHLAEDCIGNEGANSRLDPLACVNSKLDGGA